MSGREYGLHARDGRQDKQAGQDKEKREGEGKRRGVETMEGRKAELEGPKFFKDQRERGSAWWRLTWQTTAMTKVTELIMRNNCARYFWQQDYKHVGV